MSKIVIIGAGFVGSTIAFSLVAGGLGEEIVLLDADRRKAEGEVMDLSHGVAFVRPVSIRVGDYADCAGADLVIVAAGANQRPGQTRLDLTQRNVEIMRQVMPQVASYTAETTVLMVTNPVDVLTYAALKLTGYPPARVMGSGTVLDTARFRYLLSRRCGVDPRSVHAYVIGEHGDSEVAIWSSAAVAGERIERVCLAAPQTLAETRQEITSGVREAAYEVIGRKGATYWAIGLGVAVIVRSVLRNELSVLTVSGLLPGDDGGSEVCLSVPRVIGREGIVRTIPISLDQEEQAAFRRSAETVRDFLRQIAL